MKVPQAKKSPRPFHPPSTLEKLTPRQLAAVKRWLAEENISFSECAYRIRSRFGIKVSPTTLHGRYHSQFAPNAGRKIFKFRSSLDPLTDGQRGQLRRWLISGVSYFECIRRLNGRFGLLVSNAAIHHFWHVHVAPTLDRAIVRDRSKRNGK